MNYTEDGIEMTKEKLVTLSTSGKLDAGLKNSVFVRDFPAFIVDEPTNLGGTDEGPNPLEYLLGALSTCTSIMVAFIAKEQNFAYKGLEFSNSGTLDLRGLNGVEGVTTYFQTITFEAVFETEESQEKLVTLKEAVEKRCPVYNLIKDAGVQLETNWIIKK